MADTEKEIICPACGEKMKKVFIENNNMNIDICTNGCGGIFFDNRELEKVDEAHENADEILQEIENKIFKQVDTTKQRNCSVCGTPMLKYGAGNGNVEIDVCAVCGGKFLDAGELQQLRSTSKEELSDAMKSLLEYIYLQNSENINNVIANKIPEIPGRKKRHGFFIKLASEYVKKVK